MLGIQAIGLPLALGIRRWADGPLFTYRTDGLRLIIGATAPTTAEIAAVQGSACEFALASEEDVIFFLYRFAPALPWSDCPYSWHLVDEPDRVRIDAPPDAADHALLAVTLVDANTGIVRALRLTTCSPALTLALHRAVIAQAGRIFAGRAVHAERVRRLYARFPTPEALLPRAIARCCGGS